MKKAYENGFTLVELAIVMVIVGLLLGGILKGQELVESARVRSMITQIRGYQSAVNTFMDYYNALPGDMANATSRLRGCDNTNFCVNGNGSNTIGATTTNYSRVNAMGVTSLPDVETTMFWKHLAMADLISGVKENADPANPAWGSTHPACRGCRGGGGFAVLYSNETTTTDPAFGHFFMLRFSATGSPHVTNAGEGALTPITAREIEMKIDDGNSRTGIMRADTAAGLCSNTGTGVYIAAADQNCLAIFKF